MFEKLNTIEVAMCGFDEVKTWMWVLYKEYLGGRHISDKEYCELESAFNGLLRLTEIVHKGLESAIRAAYEENRKIKERVADPKREGIEVGGNRYKAV